MSELNNQNKNTNRPKPKRPPLTHFLCLPLVNAVSLPQLESSLASFKASIPAGPPPKSNRNEHQRERERPLIPDHALRPVGTLHLTLGVMSLPTPERLDEALRLFHSLDLVALIQDAERAVQKKRLDAGEQGKREKAEGTSASIPTDQAPEPLPATKRTQDEPTSTTPEPFTISLESLHALPRARSATVLHAAPVDLTSRLYPFCELLRDKFQDAGVILREYDNDSKRTKTEQAQNQPNPEHSTSNMASATNPPAGEESNLLEEMPTRELAERTAEESRPRVTTITREPKAQRKPRPLLLHATVVNTIYLRGRKRNTDGRGKDKNRRNNQYTFDARDILSRYRNFYLDADRTIPRSSVVIADAGPENSGNNGCGVGGHLEEDNAPALTPDEIDADAGKRIGEASSTQPLPHNDEKSPSYPFIWARDFPLQAVCICEMGAKKLDPGADESGMNARLGEKYAVVAERSLTFQRGDRTSMDGSNDGSVEQGGCQDIGLTEVVSGK